MKLSRLPLAIHEIGRAREIVGVIVKYGFNDWVTHNGLGRFLVTKKRLARIERFTKWERVRMAVEELGPTFIKFGQIMSDRIDLIPPELREELSRLQDKAVPLPDDVAIDVIEKSLKRKLGEVFQEFERKNLASASLAQAYRAVLLNGKEVCVKVKRPGIDRTINLDLHLMEFFAGRILRANPELEALDIQGVVKEFGKTILKELDFRNEAANIIRFRHNFREDPGIYVPEVFRDLTTREVLVEEFIAGTSGRDVQTLDEKGFDRPALARNAGRLVFEQIFTHGFFHADPHFGNIIIRDSGQISFLDFGMMGTLRPEHMTFLGKYVLGYLERDAEEITDALLLLSGKRSFAERRELEFQITEMLARYRYLTLHEMDFGKVMNESVDIIIRFGLHIPPSIYLLIKALITIERVAVTLYPQVDLAKEMEPYAVRLLAQQFNPKKIAGEVFRTLKDYYRLILELPSELNEIIYKVKEGKFRTQIELRGFEPLTEHVDKASNRVSIAIVLAALIIGASILSQWENVRWVGAVVFMIAGLFAFWLLIRLFRRNKF